MQYRIFNGRKYEHYKDIPSRHISWKEREVSSLRKDNYLVRVTIGSDKHGIPCFKIRRRKK